MLTSSASTKINARKRKIYEVKYSLIEAIYKSKY